MPIISKPVHPVRKPGEPLTVDYLSRQLAWLQWADDQYISHLERRVIALEEAIVSRRARRSLRRRIRAAVAAFKWAGPSFYERRAESVMNAVLSDGVAA